MAIVGSSFNKILVDRKKALSGKVSINNNVAIKEIVKAEMDLGKNKEKGLRFVFSYMCKYEPDIGLIDIEGDFLVIEKDELADNILKSWNDKKEIPKEYMTGMLNAVLNKCNVQALIMSQTMGLPPPIPMPSVNSEQMQKKEPVKPAKK